MGLPRVERMGPCSEPSSEAADGMFCTDVKGQDLAIQDAIISSKKCKQKSNWHSSYKDSASNGSDSEYFY